MRRAAGHVAAARTAPGGIAALWSLLLSVALLVFGTNLQGVLLPILGQEHGAGMTAIGLYSAAWSTGFVFACLSVGRLLRRVGHVRAFPMLALLSAGCASLLLLHQNDVAWIALRLVIGFCFGGLSAIIESWLIECAGSGPAFASYMIVNLLASLAGTLCLDRVNPTGRAPFILMVVSVALSSVPLLFSGLARPAPVPPFRFELKQLCLRSPLGAMGCVAAGLITGAIGGLGPVFGMESGLAMGGDTLMLAANSVGGALAYAPIGMLANRIDRRVLLAAISLLGLAVCLPLAAGGAALGPDMVVALFGAFGFAQYPLYGLCVGMVTGQAGSVSPTQISSQMLLLFGLGTIAGPLAGAQLMRIGANLFVLVALVLIALLAALLAQAMLARRATAGMPR